MQFVAPIRVGVHLIFDFGSLSLSTNAQHIHPASNALRSLSIRNN